MKLGSLAAARERQILDALEERPDITFTGQGIAELLFERKGLDARIYEAYSVACEDLARKQILKRLGSRKGEAMRYVKADNLPC